jgi:hypothetical protein
MHHRDNELTRYVTRLRFALFINPTSNRRIPVHELVLSEPKLDFALSSRHGVRAVNNIATYINSISSPYRTWFTFERIRGSKEFPSSTNDIFAFPAHGHNRARRNEINKVGKEWLITQFGVVILRKLPIGEYQLQTNKLITLSFENADNFADQAPVNSVRLYRCESPFSTVHHEELP